MLIALITDQNLRSESPMKGLFGVHSKDLEQLMKGDVCMFPIPSRIDPGIYFLAKADNKEELIETTKEIIGNNSLQVIDLSEEGE
jgi:hypothetical protein